MHQFMFFLVSFVTRLVFFILELILEADSKNYESNNFWWQLAQVILYVPWSMLPISYILWCHARTYRNTMNAIKNMRTSIRLNSAR